MEPLTAGAIALATLLLNKTFEKTGEIIVARFLWEWVESETQLLNCSESDINAAKKQLYKRHLIQRVEEREGGYKVHP
jgi:hypothetical protein